ncbi:cell division protein FtsQ [Propionibacterium cyclohexanicum]|uniref:Cell division protein FtsQ n=1 Tax=Propionibacterium cyclohexanicum TaxID=64702 RepID=A0A1H9PJA4_9ACTN|nr:FtsQ-type POTRA domain-containing protein [Propionibacterium cyclohexanicum]SER48376.1 cell division protein FtsQ [Propionibacterium cyclohexanicum]
MSVPVAPDGAPDLAIRAQVRRRRRRNRLIVAGIGATILAVLVWLVGWSTAFAVRTILVRGTVLTSQAEVVEAAEVPVGTPLAQLDTDAIAHRVESLPAVARVRVTRSWPHSVVIAVTERTLVYQRADAQGYQWIDSAGIVFHTTAQRQQVPLANLPSTDDRSLLADVATVVSHLPADVRARVQSIQASSRNNILIVLDRDQSVFWGSADESGQKAALLPVLLAQPGHAIDLSSPSAPAIK